MLERLETVERMPSFVEVGIGESRVWTKFHAINNSRIKRRTQLRCDDVTNADTSPWRHQDSDKEILLGARATFRGVLVAMPADFTLLDSRDLSQTARVQT